MLRAAAYARVSTEHEDQLNSLKNQREYFEGYIKSNPDWIYAGIYYDDCVIIGISGKNLIKSRVFGTCPFSFFAGIRNITLKVKIRH